MFKSKIDHIALSVKDINESKSFYKSVFVDFLHYRISEETENFLAIDFGGEFLFEIWQEHAEFRDSKFHRNQVGLHHFGISIESKEMVDQLYNKLLELGVEILDPPQAYPEYTPNYYAVFYTDPNGFKMEFVFS